MRSRSTSHKRSEAERRTNESININNRFHEVEIDKRQEERSRARNDVRHGVTTVHLLHMPTEGPESQGVIDNGQSAYRRTRESRSYRQRPECLPKDQRVKELLTTARVPTEGPESQGVIDNGQSAYRRTRASRRYQQGQSAYQRTRASRSYHNPLELQN